MTNYSINDAKRQIDSDVSQCNSLPIQNSTLPISIDWENIPETALLNGIFGIILYISFVYMTKIAWRRADSDDWLTSKSLITYLYGYRDPEQWYIIPRYEFLRYEDRHHKHDLKYPNIYVPPKLPVANPIEVFAYSTEHENSIESIEPNDKSAAPKSLKVKLKRTKSKKSIMSALKTPLDPDPKDAKTKKSTIPDSPIKSLRMTSPASTLATIPQNPPVTSKEFTLKSPSSLANSFFYPSILTAEQLEASYLSRKLNKFFSMFFRVTDADIIYVKGIDAYEYLLFQRHLILIMFITSLLCLCVILPIHWTIGRSYDPNVVPATSFQRSTIKNMRFDSPYYWAHIICSSLIVIFTLLIMNSYRSSTVTRDDPQLSRRTLLIGNIPAKQRNRANLLQVFEDYFSGCKIEAIQFVYDTSRLYDYQLQLDCIIVAKEYCQHYKRKYNTELMVHKTDVNERRVCNGNCRLCSFFHVCTCYWPYEAKQPGTIYYIEQERYYREKIARDCEDLVLHPSEYAFVTFRSHREAKRIMQKLAKLKQEALEEKLLMSSRRRAKRNEDSDDVISKAPLPGRKNLTFLESSNTSPNDPLDPKNNPHVRSIRSPTPTDKKRSSETAELSRDLSLEQRSSKLEGPLTWSIRYAPHPDNVEFTDLLNIANTSKYTTVLWHTLMIIIFLFVTTPNVILSVLERVSVLDPDKLRKYTGFQAIFINYLSIILQIITSSVLPALVTLISKQIPYEDASSKDHSIMWKTYLFLVLMVIIMPSIGMSSAQALLRQKIDPKCLFRADHGAYFINYVISSIFISTVFELLKFDDILSYYFILWTSRSKAEIEGGRQFIEGEFSVGMQHTSVLLIFSAVMTYCMSCPLIAPVGLVYLLVKHSVDHYHLYYTYFTKKVDKNLQGTIVLFVKVALLLMLCQTTFAISTSTGTSYFSLISQIVFCITMAAFVFNSFFDCTSRVLPSTNRRSRFQQEFCACFYLPRVIENLIRSDAIPATCISRKI